MTTADAKLSEADSSAELREFVEESLTRFRGRPSRLKRLDRKQHSYHSSFALEKLDAYFEDGSQLELIFKDLSPARMLEHARRVRPTAASEAMREVVVYRDILTHAALETATCYGSLVDAQCQRNWLLLEKVNGEELYQIGSFGIWREVARWVARMHDRLAPSAKDERLTASLLRYDEHYWDGWIDRALNVLRHGANARLAAVPANQLRWLENQCGNAARHISKLPRTVVHGELYASNILVQRRGNDLRICPIDWETAGISTGFIDLAALSAGNWSESQKQDLALVYYDEMAPGQFTRPDFDEFLTAIKSCRLLLAIKWIGWCAHWEPPVEHRFDWFQEALQMASAVDAGPISAPGGAAPK